MFFVARSGSVRVPIGPPLQINFSGSLSLAQLLTCQLQLFLCKVESFLSLVSRFDYPPTACSSTNKSLCTNAVCISGLHTTLDELGLELRDNGGNFDDQWDLNLYTLQYSTLLTLLMNTVLAMFDMEMVDAIALSPSAFLHPASFTWLQRWSNTQCPSVVQLFMTLAGLAVVRFGFPVHWHGWLFSWTQSSLLLLQHQSMIWRFRQLCDLVTAPVKIHSMAD